MDNETHQSHKTVSGSYITQQEIVYLLADVFKEFVVDLRKGFHLFA